MTSLNEMRCSYEKTDTGYVFHMGALSVVFPFVLYLRDDTCFVISDKFMGELCEGIMDGSITFDIDKGIIKGNLTYEEYEEISCLLDSIYENCGID